MCRPRKTSLLLLIILASPLLAASPQIRIVSVNYEREVSYKSTLDIFITVRYPITLQPITVFVGYSITSEHVVNYSWSFVSSKYLRAWRTDGEYITVFKATIPSKEYGEALTPNSTVLFYVYALSPEGAYSSTINATIPPRDGCERCFRVYVVDDQAPKITEVQFIPEAATPNMTIKVIANIADDSPLRNVTLTAWMWRGEEFEEVKARFSEVEPETYSATIKVPPFIDEAWYMLRAEDSFGNVNVNTGEIKIVKQQAETLRREAESALKVYMPILFTLLIAVVGSFIALTAVMVRKGVVRVTGETMETRHPKSLNLSLFLTLITAFLVFYEVRPHGMATGLLSAFLLLIAWYLIDPRTPSMPGLTPLKTTINDNPFTSLMFEGVTLALVSGGIATGYLVKLLSPAALIIFSKTLKYSVILLGAGLVLQALWPALRNIKIEFELVEEEEERRSEE